MPITPVEVSVTWGYPSVEFIVSLAEQNYVDDVAKTLSVGIKSKYSVIEEELYSTGTGGCNLGYDFETVKDTIKDEVKITKIKYNKIIFTYREKEYELVKSGDFWKLNKNIFKCIEEQ